MYEACKMVTLSEFLIPQVIVYIDPMFKDISNKPEFEVLKLPENVFPFESVAVAKNVKLSEVKSKVGVAVLAGFSFVLDVCKESIWEEIAPSVCNWPVKRTVFSFSFVSVICCKLSNVLSSIIMLFVQEAKKMKRSGRINIELRDFNLFFFISFLIEVLISNSNFIQLPISN